MKPTKHAKTNYRMLAPYIAPLNEENRYRKILNGPYMPLSIQLLYDRGDGSYAYSIAHYGTQNGDLMSDPEMEIAVNPTEGTVEPLTYRNDYVGVYQEVYVNCGLQFRPQLRTELDCFLWQWLKNIKEQGFEA